MRIGYDEMVRRFDEVLTETGFSEARSALLARLFADATRDGVQSHGVLRFAGFIRQMRSGGTDIQVEPELVGNLGIIEQYDGHMGVGPLNAHFCMARAIELAKENGIGCTALRNTNHWMRPGNYGLQAVEAGCIGICWTNTRQFMPLWGSMDPKLGSNPIVFCIPREEGPVLVDMALSQYSMGRLGRHRKAGERLPVPGGYDLDGNPTTDPEAMVEERVRPLPIGYWKGSGLSLALDLIAALLSGGKSAYQVEQQDAEISVSQVFIAFDIESVLAQQDRRAMMDDVIADLQSSQALEGHERPRYAGEGMLEHRRRSLEEGIEVNDETWSRITDL
ncbi:TPA: 3-dehydro-L-gulonate 2-dehydrogenase [Candidatus Latescibacteria bacterium]|nr:3-dehydro-L-gulonate 2-dehydrogenase [Candidatus Latescibacterota bacterium]